MVSEKNAKLLVVGDGREKIVNDLKDAISKHDLENNFEILGPVYDKKLKIELLAKSRVLILPSLEENWALVVGEALAAGVPVIAYDLPEIREVWGRHVVWIEKGDVAGFAKAIIELLRAYPHKVLANSFIDQFDWNNIAERTLSYCVRLTGQSSGTNKCSMPRNYSVNTTHAERNGPPSNAS